MSEPVRGRYVRDEAQTSPAELAAAEGALAEARKQVEREAERSALVELRHQELSERVIAEAAKAQALVAARSRDLKRAGDSRELAILEAPLPFSPCEARLSAELRAHAHSTSPALGHVWPGLSA